MSNYRGICKFCGLTHVITELVESSCSHLVVCCKCCSMKFSNDHKKCELLSMRREE